MLSSMIMSLLKLTWELFLFHVALFMMFNDVIKWTVNSLSEDLPVISGEKSGKWQKRSCNRDRQKFVFFFWFRLSEVWARKFEVETPSLKQRSTCDGSNLRHWSWKVCFQVSTLRNRMPSQFKTSNSKDWNRSKHWTPRFSFRKIALQTLSLNFKGHRTGSDDGAVKNRS